MRGLIVCAALAACGGDGQGETEATGSASLAWDASSGGTGYRLSYGTAPRSYRQAKGSGVAVGNVTRYKVSSLESATQYYFAVTAVDGNGNESPYSDEVSTQTL